MKVYWYYYKQILPVNLAITTALSLVFIDLFYVVFISFGFFLSVFLHSYFYKHAKYIYCNLGFSTGQIVLGTFFINLVIGSVFIPLLWL